MAPCPNQPARQPGMGSRDITASRIEALRERDAYDTKLAENRAAPEARLA